MRHALLVTVLIIVASVSAAAQHDVFVLAPRFARPAPILLVNERGVVIRTVTTLPDTYVYAMIPSPDNRGAWMLAGVGSGPTGVHAIDRLGRFSSQFTGVGTSGVILDAGDGTHYIIDRTPSDLLVYRFAGNAVTTLNVFRQFAPYFNGVGRDPGGDRILLRSTDPGLGYLVIDPAANTIGTLNPTRAGPSILGSTLIRYDPTTDAYVDIGTDSASQTELRQIHPATGVFTRVPLGISGFVHIHTSANDRSHPIRHYALYTAGQSMTLVGFDDAGTIHARSPVVGPFPGLQWRGIRLWSDPMGFRPLAPPNDWALELDFPGEPLRTWMIGASLTGFSGGPRLADGRAIPLAPDALTWLTAQGRTPWITPTVGQLDADGHAAIRVNANPLGGSVAGARLWFAAVVLDPALPTGIAQVAGPLRLRLR